MSIDVSCNCGKVYKIPDERSGTTFKCFLCNQEVRVPGEMRTPPPASQHGSTPQPALSGEDAERFVAHLLETGTPRKEIVKMLEEKGVCREMALELVSMPAHARQKKPRSGPMVSIVVGGLLLAGGIGIVADSLVAAAEGLNRNNYAGAMGFLLFGSFLFFRGLSRLREP